MKEVRNPVEQERSRDFINQGEPMNSRIKLISDTEVEVQRNRHSGLVSLFVHNGTTLLVNHNHFNGNLEIDAEGNDAELEVRQCWKDTGSFAALSDESAVPYAGKRMRDNEGNVVTLVRAAGSGNGWWHSEVEGSLGVLATKEYLPLTPPPKKYRPLTPVEVIPLLGKDIQPKGSKRNDDIERIWSVSTDGIYTPTLRWISFANLVELYQFVISELPCGVEEV